MLQWVKPQKPLFAGVVVRRSLSGSKRGDDILSGGSPCDGIWCGDRINIIVKKSCAHLAFIRCSHICSKRF